MPSAYAHYRFGVQALTGMDREARAEPMRFRQLFDLGLQGPDFFFFYRPLWENSVNRLGTYFHEMTGQAWFSVAADLYRRQPTPEAEAYLYGVLGHYALDSRCHPYVRSVEKDVDHMMLESEFERFLLQKDGFQDCAFPTLANQPALSDQNAAIISRYYVPATPKQVSAGVWNMQWVQRALYAGTRSVLPKAVKAVGYGRAVIPGKPQEGMLPMDACLYRCYQQALEIYPTLLRAFREALKTGKLTEPAFAPPFDPF